MKPMRRAQSVHVASSLCRCHSSLGKGARMCAAAPRRGARASSSQCVDAEEALRAGCQPPLITAQLLSPSRRRRSWRPICAAAVRRLPPLTAQMQNPTARQCWWRPRCAAAERRGLTPLAARLQSRSTRRRSPRPAAGAAGAGATGAGGSAAGTGSPLSLCGCRVRLRSGAGCAPRRAAAERAVQASPSSLHRCRVRLPGGASWATRRAPRKARARAHPSRCADAESD